MCIIKLSFNISQPFTLYTSLVRSHRWRWSCSRSLRMVRSTERSWGLVPDSRLKSPDGIPGGATDEVQFSCREDSSIWEIPVPRDHGQRQQKPWRGPGLNPKKQAMCAAQEDGVKEVVQALWSPEDHEYYPDVKYWTFYTVEVWFCFDFIVTVPWFFPHEVGSMQLIFDFTRAQINKTLEFQRHNNLTET